MHQNSLLIKSIRSITNLTKNIGAVVWHFLEAKSLLIFCLLIFLLDLSYPVTITYDSGHFLWLTSLIRERQWSLWDPVRNIGFPLLIHLSRVIFGDNANAIHYLLAFLHCILLITGINIVNLVVKNKTRTAISKFIVLLIVVLLIALDPIVFAYYNTLLTEFVSVTLTVLAVWLCILIFREGISSSTFKTILYTLFLSLLVVFSWHLKQPYVGATLFPFILLAAVLFVNKSTRKRSAIVLIGVAVSIIAVFMTTQLWNHFLLQNGNPMPTERQVTNLIRITTGNRLRCKVESSTEKENIIRQYLAFSNFYYFDQSICEIITEPKLFRSSENGAIAYIMFLYNDSNVLLDKDLFTNYVKMFRQPGNYSSDRIDKIFLGRLPISNFLFTSSMLLLPFCFVGALLIFFVKKTELTAILTIMLGTSLGNLLGHIVTGIYPIDRYLLLSYVLNLLSLIIVIFALGDWIIHFIQKISNKNLAENTNLT